MNLAALQHL